MVREVSPRSLPAHHSQRSTRASRSAARAVALLGLVGAAVGVLWPMEASAAQAPVGLGTAKTFSVLAGSTVTNTGPSVLSGDLGLSPGTAVTGFPPGVVHGTEHVTDAVASQAQKDLTTAYNDAAGRTPVTTVSKDLGGQTLAPGVYHAAKAMSLTGTVTLDAQGDPSAVFVFQAGSTLITASSSTVELVRGAQACNVFWQVGSSATLGTGTTFVGSILALTSDTLDTRATVDGRVLARNGAVTLDDNTITVPTCSTPTTTTTELGGSSTTTTTVAGGGSTTTTVGGGTTTTVPGGSTTTVPGGGATTTVPSPTTVPGTKTGEPWAGWPYWALVGVIGIVGFVAIDRAVRIRRSRE
jgi:hypothetical protein